MKNTNEVAAHTPGPWRWDAQTGYIVGADHKTVAGFDRPFKPLKTSDEATRPANARLIATAPELLEALQALVVVTILQTITDNECQNTVPSSRQIAKARAAIAKATGVAK